VNDDGSRPSGVYISGKISGDPRCGRRFDGAERRLRNRGWELCYNPHRLTRATGYSNYSGALRFDIGMILTSCTHILMLRGWRESRGAVVEWCVAKACGLTIMYDDPADRHDEFIVSVSPAA